jgi:nitrogenase molybdenum-iron protein NifN
LTGFLRVALALDPDLLAGFAAFLHGMGAQVVGAVSPLRAEVLADLPCAAVQIGDLEDLERAAAADGAQLLVASSHAAPSAERLGVPLLRAGFPQYDRVGGQARAWIGYRGTRDALFEIANLCLGQHHDIPAYRSRYRAEAPPAPAGAGLAGH